MDALTAATSTPCILLAGLCEIGGGYLVRLWLREGKPLWFAFLGAAVLVVYAAHPRCSRRTSGASIRLLKNSKLHHSQMAG